MLQLSIMLNRRALNTLSPGKLPARKILSVFLVCLLFGLIIFDRAGWASVSQWREDQATNLWLGYTRSPLELPVGLISSYDIPNPNGLPLLAIALSRLPGLLSISATLGTVQVGLIIWTIWRVFGATRPAFIILGPLLSSVFLRAISVEFWGQWLMVPVDLLFFGLAVSYLRRPSAKFLPLMLLVVLLPASLYLAGIANAVVFALLFLLLILFIPPESSTRGWILSGATGLAVLVAFVGLTWLPYFRAVGWEQIGAIFTGKLPWIQKIFASALAMLRFPGWSVLQWSRGTLAPIHQSSPDILPRSSSFLIASVSGLQLVQVLLALGSLGLFLFSLRRSGSSAASRWRFSLPAKAWMLALAFSVLSCGLSPLLGGPDWTRFERPDQSIQILPFLIFLWFSAPFVFDQAAKPLFRQAAAALSALYVFANVILGYQVITSHLNYRGETLSNSDVPLVQKTRAVDFIARDWRQASGSQTIPVYYDLEGRWPWINDMGRSMNQWYPAPMTIGRSFDYEFLRKYGLTNAQEGVQLRREGEGGYTITYAFQDHSVDSDCSQAVGRLLVLKDCPPP